MGDTHLSDADLDAVADRVIDRLDPGQYGGKILLTRRQLAALAGGGLSAGALATLGIDTAAADAAGQVGTDADPVDVFGFDIEIENQLADGSSTPMLASVAAAGSVTLSSGTATVDTGVGTATTTEFFVALGPATTDAEVAASIRADSGSGSYEVDIQETETSVGNPTVRYSVVRVR